MGKGSAFEAVVVSGSESLAAAGRRLTAAAEQMLKEASVPNGAMEEQNLGMLKRTIRTNEGHNVALFQNKAAAELDDGSMVLLDWRKIPSNFNKPRYLLYDGNASGKELIESMLHLRIKHPDEQTFFLNPPEVASKILARKGAEEGFLQMGIPSTFKPLAMGKHKLAFSTPDNDIALLGETHFREPVPDMLFPNKRIENKDLQIERLTPFNVGRITPEAIIDVVDSTDKAGWWFWDMKQTNLGRGPDGAVKIIDSGAVSRTPMDFSTSDHATALDEYAKALPRVIRQIGADSYPAGGFHSELGWHHLQTGNFQRAEEHLATGLKILEQHQDWRHVKEASDRLLALYQKSASQSKTTEFLAHNMRSDELLKGWEERVQPHRPRKRG